MSDSLTEAGKGIFQNDSLKVQLKERCLHFFWSLEVSSKLMTFFPHYAYKWKGKNKSLDPQKFLGPWCPLRSRRIWTPFRFQVYDFWSSKGGIILPFLEIDICFEYSGSVTKLMHRCLFFHLKWLRINYCVEQAGRINGLVACKVAHFKFLLISLSCSWC